MALIVPDVGESKMLTMILKDNSAITTQTLKLYVNNYTPIETTVASDMTEMSTLGYAAKTLARASWTVSGTAPCLAAYAQQAFTFTAGSAVTVYGYFVIDTGTGILLWAEKFANAQVVQNLNDEIRITPQITLD